MKRLLSLFSLLLLTMGGVISAQRITSIGDVVTDGNFNTHDHYVIKLVSYYNGDNKVDMTEDKYLYAVNGGRVKLSTINVSNYEDNNNTQSFLVNMQETDFGDGIFAVGLGSVYIPSFTSGSGPFNCTQTQKTNYAYKFIPVGDGTYKMQGYLGNTPGYFLNYNASTDEVNVLTEANKSKAMTVQVYKANTPFEEGKFYNLTMRAKDGGNRNVVLINGLQINTQTTKSTDPDGVWFFKKEPNVLCKWYMYNAEAGDDFGVTAITNDNSRAELTQNPTSFSVGLGKKEYTQEGGFSLILSGDATLNDVSGSLGIWNNAGAPRDGGSSLLSTVVEGNYARCTFTFKDATNNQTVVRNIYRKVGEVPSIPAIPYFTATTTSLSNAVTADGENAFTVNGTFNYPFTLAEDDNDANSWINLSVRVKQNPTGRDLMISEDGNKVYTKVNYKSQISTYSKFNDGLFRFVKAGNTGFFKIKSRSGKFIKWNVNTNLQGYNHTIDKVELTTTTNETEASAFTILKSKHTEATDKDFSMQPICAKAAAEWRNSSQYACGDHNGNYLSLWTGDGGSDTRADDGSRFRIKDVTNEILTTAATVKSNELKEAFPSTTLGGYTDAAINTLKSTTYNTLNDLETAITAMPNEASNLQTPIDGQLYRISFVRGNVTAAGTNAEADANGEVKNENNKTLLALIEGTMNTPSALVRFHKDGEYYTIEDVNSGFYYGAYKSNDEKLYLVPSNSESKGKFSIVNTFDGTVGHVALKENTTSVDTKRYLWSCGSEANEVLNVYPYVKLHSGKYNNIPSNEAIEQGCVLSVQQNTTYPISISQAGYASLCLPFSVTLPESGLTAYKVSDISKNENNQNELTLVNIGNTIAAGEPVILEGSAANYTLTINAENGTKSTGNILTGASVKRTGITDEYYALAYKSLNSENADAKTAGFFRVTTTNMPANKAYLLKKDIPAQSLGAALFFFNSNNETTGILNVVNTENNSNVYYDLNGRRVLYPTRGIYVKGNGQKVFIK